LERVCSREGDDEFFGGVVLENGELGVGGCVGYCTHEGRREGWARAFAKAVDESG
jgi:hypothetical protein